MRSIRERMAEAGLALEGESLRWYLVFTKAQGERTAQINLERQGFGVYCPRLASVRIHRHLRVERVVALFPRYLFVRVDPASQSLAPVRSTVGVARIVTFGGEAAAVPNTIVDALMERADPRSGLHRFACVSRLQRGSAIRLTGGAFTNLEGIFECESGNDRSIVLLDLLGRHTCVQVPSHFVAPSGVAEWSNVG